MTHPIFDKDLMWYEAEAMTIDLTSDPLELVGGQGKQMAACVLVPEAADPADTINVQVEASVKDAASYVMIAQNVKGAEVIPTEGKTFIVPFELPAGKWDVRIKIDGTSSGADFGDVTAGVVFGVTEAYDRSQHFA